MGCPDREGVRGKDMPRVNNRRNITTGDKYRTSSSDREQVTVGPWREAGDKVGAKRWVPVLLSQPAGSHPWL